MSLIVTTNRNALRTPRSIVPPRTPAPPRRPQPVAERLTAGPLRALLEEVNARDLYGYVTRGMLYAADPADAEQRADSLGEIERSVARLLFLGLPAPKLAAPTIPVIDRLLEADLLEEGPAGMSTNGWVLVAAHRGYLVVGTPPHYPTATSNASRAYLGADSLILAEMLPRPLGRSILDLGAGCGIHGLLAADGASRAVLTEIDAGALAIARFNHALNDVAHPVEFRLGANYDPVEGERFDSIVTLAPYVPTVPGAESSTVFAGGIDGLDVLRPFIGGASGHLEPGGEFLAIAQLLCDDDGTLLARELDTLAPGLGVHLTCDSWHPLQPYLLELTGRLAAHGSPLSQRELLDRYRNALRPLGVTGVATTRIRLRRPPTGTVKSAWITTAGTVPAIAVRDVPVLGSDVSGTATPAGILLVANGKAHLIDGPTAELVTAIDGARSLSEIVEKAWSAPEGMLLADLTDQAIRRLGELEAAGLLTFARR